MADRLETGVIIPGGGDWPGVFIRGDDALMYASKLKFLLEVAVRTAKAGQTPMFEVISWNKMQDLVDLLESCRAPGPSVSNGVRGIGP